MSEEDTKAKIRQTTHVCYSIFGDPLKHLQREKCYITSEDTDTMDILQVRTM